MKVLVISMLILATKVTIAKKTDQTKATRGPYRAVLVSVWNCPNTTFPLEKDPPIQMHMWTVNSKSRKVRLLSSNTTVLRETKQVRLKIKAFIMEHGRWKLYYSVNGITCHGKLLDLICKTVGFSLIDTTKCLFRKGSYTFDGLDIDSIEHLVASEMDYGETLWRTELIVGLSTYHCFDCRILFEPL